jgi:phosphopantetheinyl transferase
VRKEAVLKAGGFGLATDPRRIVVTAGHEPPRFIAAPPGDDAAHWQLRDVELTAGYVCAAAVRMQTVGPLDVQVAELDVRALVQGGSSGLSSHMSLRVRGGAASADRQ